MGFSRVGPAAMVDPHPDPVGLDPVWLLGVRISPTSLQQLLTFIEKTILQKRRALISNVNVKAMGLAWQGRRASVTGETKGRLSASPSLLCEPQVLPVAQRDTGGS